MFQVKLTYAYQSKTIILMICKNWTSKDLI